ncbi:MAG: lipid-A-disaccharide synthase [Phormidesmis sp.]
MSAAPMAVESVDAPSVAEPIDIVILANGPGEVATWVKPVVRALQSKTASLATSYRISVILSPCPHASGQEPLILSGYPEVTRVQSAPHFFKFLLTGKTADAWDWRPKGIVVFLGGDQLYTVLVAKRLGYRTVTYAEWDARWPSLIDGFGVMQQELIEKAPASQQEKFTVVGDLMADVQAIASRTEITHHLSCPPNAELLGFLPGSKPAKLEMGIPMVLAIAALIHPHRPQSQFVVGVAPNLTLTDLNAYTDPKINPAVSLLQAPIPTLHKPKIGLPYWQIENGPKVHLWQSFPALDLFSQCQLCITTVGANTAQLGALGTPMIVLLPTQRLGAAQLADGLPGLLSRLPGVGAIARNLINPLIIKTLQKSGKHFAWPNIWAKREVVPELFGPITPQQVTTLALNYLEHPQKLEEIRQTLRTLRGPAGAAEKMADLILETVNYPK